MSLSKQHPTMIVARCLLLEQLRKIDPVEVGKITPNFVIVYNEIDDKEEVKEVTQINWKYALFGATDHELQKLFDNFVKKEEKSPVSPEVKEAGEVMEKQMTENEITEQPVN